MSAERNKHKDAARRFGESLSSVSTPAPSEVPGGVPVPVANNMRKAARDLLSQFDVTDTCEACATLILHEEPGDGCDSYEHFACWFARGVLRRHRKKAAHGRKAGEP